MPADSKDTNKKPFCLLLNQGHACPQHLWSTFSSSLLVQKYVVDAGNEFCFRFHQNLIPGSGAPNAHLGPIFRPYDLENQ